MLDIYVSTYIKRTPTKKDIIYHFFKRESSNLKSTMLNVTQLHWVNDDDIYEKQLVSFK